MIDPGLPGAGDPRRVCGHGEDRQALGRPRPAARAGREVGQRLAPTGGIDGDRRQQVAQLPGRAGVEAAEGAAGEPRNLLEGAGRDLVAPLVEQEAGHPQQSELAGQLAEPVDVLLEAAERSVGIDIGWPDGIADAPYVLATIHRAENTDDPHRLASIIDALAGLDLPVVLPVHPRVRALAADRGLELDSGSLVPVEPLDYDRMIAAVRGATAVATDSGGLQKEAFVLGTPTTTIRTETEWVETLVDGWNVLSPAVEDISANITRPTPTADRGTPYGSGLAAVTAAAAVMERYA